MTQNSPDPEQTTDVQELLELSESFNPNVSVTIAPMSETEHRTTPSNISKKSIIVKSFFIELRN